MTSTRHDSNDSSLLSSGPIASTTTISATFCPCQSVESCNPHPSSGGGPLNVYCPTCVRRILSAQIEKHVMALDERNRSRSWCASQLLELRSDDNDIDNNDNNDNDDSKLDDDNCSLPSKTAAALSARHKIAQYRDSFSQLQKKLEYLRRECVTVSVSLASKSMANDERATDLNVQKNRIIVARHELERLSNSVLFSQDAAFVSSDETSMIDADETTATGEHDLNTNPADQNYAGSTLNDSLHTRIQEVKQKRFHLALQAFEMHRMDVGTEYNNLTLDDFLQYDNNNNNNNNDTATSKNDNQMLELSQFQRRIRDKEEISSRLATFEMHRMDVGTEYNNLTLDDFLKYDNSNDTATSKNDNQMLELSQFQRRIRDKVISGIGKIGGLPLPHRGALYNYLRSDVLTSSLRLVASLTQLLARCLGILLPRPILLRPIMDRSGGSATPRFVSNECRFKHRTDDIITNVTSTPGWYKLETQAKKKGINTSPNDITTLQDLDELGKETNGTEDTTTRGASNSVHIVPSDSVENAAAAATVSNDTLSQSYQRAKSTLASTSTNSLLSLVGSSSNMLSRAFVKMKGNQNQQQRQQSNSRSTTGDGENMDGIPNAVMASMDDLSVSARLRHASCAVICDNITSNASSSSSSSSSTTKTTNHPQQRNDSGTNGMHYELRPPQYASNTSSTPSSSNSGGGGIDRDALNQQEENFIMGLHLLQNNVIALSLQAGVPVSALWPAEAVLLNLHSLKLFCMEQNLM
eukprot:CAMPEP_0198276502 /NCGR_PEP_ID=MMETSP1447-20131203/65345_1 /TAXON_ID=420782 /ORGANISM="Chaetoceros dichaeta, Strain CCMP1751" /LENGTH=751 /DNA_ID=CAMNT_0043971457 /DNA_START=35 /DNA_END=2291 /DNA_ORIENTATION=-